MKNVPSTSCNPTANALCERMHQTVGNVVRTLVNDNPLRGTRQDKDLIDEALSIVQHTLRGCSVHSTLKSSPGSLVFSFSRDMFVRYTDI